MSSNCSTDWSSRQSLSWRPCFVIFDCEIQTWWQSVLIQDCWFQSSRTESQQSTKLKGVGIQIVFILFSFFSGLNLVFFRYTSLYFMKDHKTGIFTGTQYWVLPWESSKLWYDDHEWKSQMFSVMAQHIFHDDKEDRTAWGISYVLTKVFLYDVEICRFCWMC